VRDVMPLFKAWVHVDALDVDVSHIFPASSIEEALQIAKAYASSLNGKLKVVDNIHTGMSASPFKNPKKR
jgi:hypothetical protein